MGTKRSYVFELTSHDRESLEPFRSKTIAVGHNSVDTLSIMNKAFPDKVFTAVTTLSEIDFIIGPVNVRNNDGYVADMIVTKLFSGGHKVTINGHRTTRYMESAVDDFLKENHPVISDDIDFSFRCQRVSFIIPEIGFE